MTVTREVLPVTQFRVQAHEWLSENAQPSASEPEEWGKGSDSVALFHDYDEVSERRAVEAAKEWHKRKAAAGWTSLTWPAEYGGHALTGEYELAFSAEERHFEVPDVPEAVRGTLSLVGPTLDRFGTAFLKERYLRTFLDLDLVCCQLFSEPDAGSDLASLSCRAVPTGDGTWKVSGQKVWTSGARTSDLGLILTRTDVSSTKHRGITAFLVDMSAPGVSVRPIRQMTGGASFNEVFFDEVAVHDDHRLGDVGAGWTVAMTMLSFERSASAALVNEGGTWSHVARLARHLGRDTDPLVRDQIASLYIEARLLEFLNQRATDQMAGGGAPGAASSVTKLAWANGLQSTADVASRLLGASLVADTGEWGTFTWGEHVIGICGYHIAGGSDEIQRNILAERVLGLPR